MADFRKMFYALAIVALIACFTVPAGAQSLNCTDLHATNQVIRVEGWSELAGDIVLGCSGTGATTAAGNLVQAADITVTIPQTQIASKLLNPSGNVPLSEATLIIDDLKDPSFTSASNFPGSRTHLICSDTTNPGGLGVCQIISTGNPANTYSGAGGHPNIFVGRANGASAVVFPGVPLDPPGTGFTRTLRITNLRVNATVFDPTNVFAQVIAIVTFQGPAAVGLNNVQTTIATVQKGNGGTKVQTDNTFLQCDYPLNTLAKNDNPPPAGTGPGFIESHGVSTLTSGCVNTSPCVVVDMSGNVLTQPIITLSEGFQTAWKPRNMSELLGPTGSVLGGGANPPSASTSFGAPISDGNGNGGLGTNFFQWQPGHQNNPNDIAQDNPQVRYFTEGGFSETSLTAIETTANAIPYLALNVQFPNGASGGGAGTADWGTRMQFTISNIPNGTTLSLPTSVRLKNGSLFSGIMVMVSTTANGAGAFNRVAASSGLASLTNSGYFDLTGPSATVTYEVLMSDPFSTEKAAIYPILYFPALSLPTSVSNDLPQAGVGVQVTPYTFAPWYAATGNQSTNPPGQVDGTPRFVQTTGATQTLLTISRCTCSLLFPWVVSDQNYVTGIAVANTSKDPTNGLTPTVIGYNAVQSAGKVQLYLFGTILGVSAQTNTTIAAQYPGGDTVAKAGSYATFVVNTGFTGYAITQANFQYCHGLAFLFNGNGGVPPVSYLGLVMDTTPATGLPRTGLIGDAEGQ